MPANQITTKFSLKQKVWLMEDNKAVELEVESVETSETSESQSSSIKFPVSISYGFRQYEDTSRRKFKAWKKVHEKLIFETKADLLASL